ncbi:MAG: hypothetical protein ACSLE7_08535 [Mycobacterium sp.]|jgi:hypothetical protein
MGNPPYDDLGTDDLGTDDLATDDLGTDDDGLAALDFSVAVPVDDGDCGLDAFDDSEPVGETGEPLFTVTNPPGTVTVSACFDGRVQRIELSPEAATDSEDRLAAEIVVIAALATQRARAAQFSYMLAGMQDHGHDTVDTRDFLSHSIGLPSPAEADATEAEVFATRYAGEHD